MIAVLVHPNVDLLVRLRHVDQHLAMYFGGASGLVLLVVYMQPLVLLLPTPAGCKAQLTKNGGLPVRFHLEPIFRLRVAVERNQAELWELFPGGARLRRDRPGGGGGGGGGGGAFDSRLVSGRLRSCLRLSSGGLSDGEPLTAELAASAVVLTAGVAVLAAIAVSTSTAPARAACRVRARQTRLGRLRRWLQLSCPVNVRRPPMHKPVMHHTLCRQTNCEWLLQAISMRSCEASSSK